MDLQLKDKRVLITGSSRGIGLTIAMAFAREGAQPILVARERSNLDKAEQAFAQAQLPKPPSMLVDLSRSGSAEELRALVPDVDILVNNAGAIPGGSVEDVGEARWREAWELKVFGYINLTRAVYAQMKAKKRGVVVNVLGNAGEKLNAAYIAGSTANAGLMAFTRALGGASHADGIRVLGVSPGPVETDRLLKLYKQMAEAKLGDANRYRELYAGMAFDRPATSDEIAWTVVFGASDRSSYTTGIYITIDGGLAARS